MLEELKRLEPEFSESMMLSKIDNIFILMLNAIMFRDMARIYSSLNEEMRKSMETRINFLKQNHEIQMFDELNVKHTVIRRVEILEDRYRMEVEVISRYMDYRLDENTRQVKAGDNTHRIEKNNLLVLEEKRNHKSLGLAIKCPNCGASINYNQSGVCEYCKAQMPKEDYDWIVTSWSEN